MLRLLGVSADVWYVFGAEQARNAVFVWGVVGIIHQFWVGRVFSLSTALLIFPGFLIASLAAAPLAIVNFIKTKQLLEIKAHLRRRRVDGLLPEIGHVSVLLAWTAWWLFDIAAISVLAVIFLRLLNAHL